MTTVGFCKALTLYMTISCLIGQGNNSRAGCRGPGPLCRTRRVGIIAKGTREARGLFVSLPDNWASLRALSRPLSLIEESEDAKRDMNRERKDWLADRTFVIFAATPGRGLTAQLDYSTACVIRISPSTHCDWDVRIIPLKLTGFHLVANRYRLRSLSHSLTHSLCEANILPSGKHQWHRQGRTGQGRAVGQCNAKATAQGEVVMSDSRTRAVAIYRRHTRTKVEEASTCGVLHSSRGSTDQLAMPSRDSHVVVANSAATQPQDWLGEACYTYCSGDEWKAYKSSTVVFETNGQRVTFFACQKARIKVQCRLNGFVVVVETGRTPTHNGWPGWNLGSLVLISSVEARAQSTQRVSGHRNKSEQSTQGNQPDLEVPEGLLHVIFSQGIFPRLHYHGGMSCLSGAGSERLVCALRIGDAGSEQPGSAASAPPGTDNILWGMEFDRTRFGPWQKGARENGRTHKYRFTQLEGPAGPLWTFHLDCSF
ncbi:hypothetical protein ACRALDRAFT_213823 [Sodiomyces alcalophilus JCM 7366]|uniref:uncharacterized protein n=1 Tax=Sodiomyces alcalophilus JCM 7366 TaxID=591952 RepID=UPI0039B3BF36